MKRGYPFTTGNLNYGYSYEYVPKTKTSGGSDTEGRPGPTGPEGPKGPAGPAGTRGLRWSYTFNMYFCLFNFFSILFKSNMTKFVLPIQD